MTTTDTRWADLPRDTRDLLLALIYPYYGDWTQHALDAILSRRMKPNDFWVFLTARDVARLYCWWPTLTMLRLIYTARPEAARRGLYAATRYSLLAR